ncbi:hypothetical protein HOY82DRAFT_613106 [Tuber indicum]|nr:hypothetical protein HOY82DRAFT_613106 [Tuber indicum]
MVLTATSLLLAYEVNSAVFEEKLDKFEVEEEKILANGGKEEWEVFSWERVKEVRKSFRIMELVLPIDGSCDYEISVRGVDTAYLVDGLRNWEIVEIVEMTVIDLDKDNVELAETGDDADVFYEEIF